MDLSIFCFLSNRAHPKQDLSIPTSKNWFNMWMNMKQESYHMILTYNLKNTQWNINLFNYYEIIIKSFSILHCLFNCVLPAIYFSCFFPAVFYILKWLLFSPEVFFWFLSFHKVYVISRNFNFHVSEFYCGPLFLFIFGWQTANHNYEQQQKKERMNVLYFSMTVLLESCPCSLLVFPLWLNKTLIYGYLKENLYKS